MIIVVLMMSCRVLIIITIIIFTMRMIVIMSIMIIMLTRLVKNEEGGNFCEKLLFWAIIIIIIIISAQVGRLLAPVQFPLLQGNSQKHKSMNRQKWPSSPPYQGTWEWSLRLRSRCPSAACDPKAQSSQGQGCWWGLSSSSNWLISRLSCFGLFYIIIIIILTWAHKRTHWLWRSACGEGSGLQDFSCNHHCFSPSSIIIFNILQSKHIFIIIIPVTIIKWEFTSFP